MKKVTTGTTLYNPELELVELERLAELRNLQLSTNPINNFTGSGNLLGGNSDIQRSLRESRSLRRDYYNDRFSMDQSARSPVSIAQEHETSVVVNPETRLIEVNPQFFQIEGQSRPVLISVPREEIATEEQRSVFAGFLSTQVFREIPLDGMDIDPDTRQILEVMNEILPEFSNVRSVDLDNFRLGTQAVVDNNVSLSRGIHLALRLLPITIVPVLLFHIQVDGNIFFSVLRFFNLMVLYLRPLLFTVTNVRFWAANSLGRTIAQFAQVLFNINLENSSLTNRPTITQRIVGTAGQIRDNFRVVRGNISESISRNIRDFREEGVFNYMARLMGFNLNSFVRNLLRSGSAFLFFSLLGQALRNPDIVASVLGYISRGVSRAVTNIVRELLRFTPQNSGTRISDTSSEIITRVLATNENSALEEMFKDILEQFLNYF